MRAPHFTRTLEKFNKIASYYGLERAYPFADRDLIAFMMADPGEVVLWNGIYKGLFREAMHGILPDKIHMRYWKADFTQLDSDATAALVSKGHEGNLGSDSLAVKHGYIDVAALPSAIADSRARLTGRANLPLSQQLTELFCFELWLEAFFAPDVSAEKC